jgi:hypothetical protein
MLGRREARRLLVVLTDGEPDDVVEAARLLASRGGRARRTALADADATLNKLRLYLRLAHRWRWLSDGQYEHVSRLVAAIGRLRGGWIRRAASERG